MKIFYQRLIVIEPLLQQLQEMDLSDKERTHLLSLVDSSLHHVILDEILSNLEEADKRLFLKKVHDDPGNEELLEFLNQKIENIEDKIKSVSNDLVTQMHEDIKEAKKLKEESK